MSIYAVNGKEPIAAWIPSLDTAGNGTTTLTDLVGSNNGTLTNMDAATDWVTDTDAGGVRALEFDGVNDRIETIDTSQTNNLSAMSVLAWVRLDDLLNNNFAGAVSRQDSFSNRWYMAQDGNDAGVRIGVANGGDAYGTVAPSGFAEGVWCQWLMVYDGTMPTDEEKLTFYFNGQKQTLTIPNPIPSTTPSNSLRIRIGALASNYWEGAIDDVRIWDQAITAEDVADLYAGGLGRGVDASGASTTSSPRRRRSMLMGGGL
jgi:hypothetical protein